MDVGEVEGLFFRLLTSSLLGLNDLICVLIIYGTVFSLLNCFLTRQNVIKIKNKKMVSDII